MALPTLNWKFVGCTSAGANTVSGFLEAFYQLTQLEFYADGEERVPGVDCAWLWDKSPSVGAVTAVYGISPFAQSGSLGIRYILAGDGTSPTARLTPDTTVASNVVWLGMNRGTGVTYSSWSAAQPFGSGFSGFWKCFYQVTVPNSVFLWESQETTCVGIVTNTGNIQIAQFGALYDPLTATGVETDGRLYFMQTPGVNGIFSANFWLSNPNQAQGTWGNYNVTDGANHLGRFTPGATSVSGAIRLENFGGSSNIASSASGRAVLYPFHVCSVVSGSSPGSFVGQSRSAYLSAGVQSMAVHKTQDGATIGYGNAPSTFITQPGVLLKA